MVLLTNIALEFQQFNGIKIRKAGKNALTVKFIVLSIVSWAGNHNNCRTGSKAIKGQ